MVKRYSSHDYTESETGWLVPKTDYDALAAELADVRKGEAFELAQANEENERLRAALKRIADYSPGFTPIAGDPIEIARSALAVSEGENG